MRDVWRDCQTISEYASRFQSSKKSINAIIQGCANIRLTAIDKKNTLELGDFLLQQEKTRGSALSSLEARYTEIVGQLRSIEEVPPARASR